MALTVPETALLTTRRAEIKAKLAEGASRVTTDGVTVVWELDELRKELAEIDRLLYPTKRPRVASFDLSRGA